MNGKFISTLGLFDEFLTDIQILVLGLDLMLLLCYSDMKIFLLSIHGFDIDLGNSSKYHTNWYI